MQAYSNLRLWSLRTAAQFAREAEGMLSANNLIYQGAYDKRAL